MAGTRKNGDWWKAYGVPVVVGILSGGSGTYVGSQLVEYRIAQAEARVTTNATDIRSLESRMNVFDKDFAVFKTDLKHDITDMTEDSKDSVTKIDGLGKDVNAIRGEITEAKQECKRCDSRR